MVWRQMRALVGEGTWPFVMRALVGEGTWWVTNVVVQNENATWRATHPFSWMRISRWELAYLQRISSTHVTWQAESRRVEMARSAHVAEACNGCMTVTWPLSDRYMAVT